MLERVESQMQLWIDELENKTIKELFSLLPKGKRLRAKLVLKVAGISDESIKLAAVIEMIHAASLLHDDVIDDAMTRRGVTSLNATEGSKQAVMMGDILYSKGFEELVSFKKDISSIIASAVTQLSIGELMDVRLSDKFNPDIDAYMKMIYQKTAALIEASASSAAILAGKDKEVYATYGRNLGIAFQIIDDILDITSTSEQLGKPAMADYEEGKTTLPYIYLYEALDEDNKAKLLSLHGVKLTEDQKIWIRKVMEETGALKKSYSYAKKLGDEAVTLMKNECQDSLADIVTAMIERDF
ncbi:polyprenyl synthetase family protein [Hydrogenimonas thermophila]|uniref:polyprenyl synthetase family protein n=1 Tax=Hydrogenimonas thermophila TaxID=223786 RepID=UPI00293740DF|nr:polyprenyl synthetase family protein [Hydrogenimonas thermophila]WOE71162.1 polyprenyl synthetase family protein [Hydrogenimonas thermophila]WOE73680.1 polyprenyl synthetase family protein [Hydrogenimonas thermophila]